MYQTRFEKEFFPREVIEESRRTWDALISRTRPGKACIVPQKGNEEFDGKFVRELRRIVFSGKEDEKQEVLEFFAKLGVTEIMLKIALSAAPGIIGRVFERKLQ